MTDGIPCCRTSEDVTSFSGRRVRMFGTYVEIDLRKRATSPLQFRGRAGVRLEDGALVLLEPSWSDAGIRPADERRRLAGKRVEASGTLHEEPMKPPRPIAFVHYPCLTPVESVTERR
jgi:hypothetical protein